MNLASLAKVVEKFVLDNSPTIMTAIGVTGTVSCAILTGKASFKANDVINDENERRLQTPSEPVLNSFTDKVKLVWKLYIPAASTGAITIVVIIYANRIGTRRAAAMAAAYSISDRAFTEYKDKVVAKLGKNKEEAVRAEIAQDRVNRNPSGEVVVVGRGDVLCYDSYTGRYFMSSMENIKKAQNDTNYEMIHNSYCSLTDFWSRLGLPATSFSDELGWTSDHPLELTFSTTISDDGRPCLAMDFRVQPIRAFDRFG